MKASQRWAGNELPLWLGLSAASALLLALAVVLRGGPGPGAARLVLIGIGTMTAGLGWSVFVPARLQQRLPGLALITFAGLGATGLVDHQPSPGLDQVYMIAFVFVGLTQRRGVPSLLLLAALPAWLVTNTPVTVTVLAKLPLACGSWVLVGEVLASFTARHRRTNGELERLAQRDAVTGLLNRHCLDERLAALRPGDAVVFLDLDHFKKVNDTFGHAYGDELLADLGRVVLAVLRRQDHAVRYGGEEVLLLLPRAGHDGADRALARLRQAWAAAHKEITYSAGVAEVLTLGPEAVLAADEALYAAKEAGRNRVLHAPGNAYARLALG
jgi:diguanylate cyclase (GGDEF)-like protein